MATSQRFASSAASGLHIFQTSRPRHRQAAMPAGLKASLFNQLTAAMLLTFASAAAGSWSAASLGLLCVAALAGIRRLLGSGSAGALMGAGTRQAWPVAC